MALLSLNLSSTTAASVPAKRRNCFVVLLVARQFSSLFLNVRSKSFFLMLERTFSASLGEIFCVLGLLFVISIFCLVCYGYASDFPPTEGKFLEQKEGNLSSIATLHQLAIYPYVRQHSFTLFVSHPLPPKIYIHDLLGRLQFSGGDLISTLRPFATMRSFVRSPPRLFFTL